MQLKNTLPVLAVMAGLAFVAALPVAGQPYITSITPATVPAIYRGLVTINGMNFNNADEVRVGPFTLKKGQFKIENADRITFSAPRPPYLGDFRIKVHTPFPGTWSNSKDLRYVPTSPPALTAPATGNGGVPFKWEFGAQPGETWILTIALNSNATFPLPVPGNPKILFYFYILSLGVLDGTGLGTFQLTPPPGPLIGITVYSQVVIFGTAITVSNITATKFVS